MPIIQKNSERLTPSNSGQRIIQAQRGEIIYREDIRITAAYLLVGLTVITITAGLGYLFIQQLRK